jgi:hypothetical protein
MARALLPEKGASKIYIAISYSGQNVWLFRKIPCDTMPCDLMGGGSFVPRFKLGPLLTVPLYNSKLNFC